MNSQLADVLDGYFDAVRRDGYVVDGVTGSEVLAVLGDACRIETTQQLDELPYGVIIRSDSGLPLEKVRGHGIGDTPWAYGEQLLSSGFVTLPCQLLFSPEWNTK